MTDNLTVKVAVRVRPLVDHEISKGCKDILDVVEENEQIIVKSIEKDKAFTFNYVLSSKAPQNDLYSRCVQPLIQNVFKGYNVTILAYGQTGSGKTHSMGTTYDGTGEMGVIPRAVTDIFEVIKDNFSYDFTITVSFLELYQEVIYDLLSGKPREQCILDIREDIQRGIYIPGLTEVPVLTVKEVLDVLQKGSLGRATGSTAMNMHSSRSHAVFSVNISMNNKTDSKENKQAKLHLVDLAGSERPKKTGAVGNTFKEGVNINKGLFVLGNVISCLGDEKAQHGYIPYRDSNLTRLLKDSLGGNSITLMIACVSPADYNIEETLSTLRYADRARKIKNKPVINQDARVAEINDLKKTVQQLRLQIIGQGISPTEIEHLKTEIVNLKLRIRDLTCQLSSALVDNTGLHEKLIIFQNCNEALSKKLQELQEEFNVTITNINFGIENNSTENLKENLVRLKDIQKQFVEIHSEQKKAEDEIREHEVSLNQHLINQTQEDPKELDENHELHTKRQMDLNMQLSDIQKQLIIKEGLAKQLNMQYVVDYEAMAENETKLANLQREKDELLELLKNAGVSGKLSDQRKKRVEELEHQLLELKRKVTEQARLLKLKAGNEEKINRLNNEILHMKQAKVKLIRTIREEADKFKHWRFQKEKECMKLKEQDRKKEGQITKMKVMHSKQQIVLRRRMEQAEALNKRLKNALATRKQVQDTKNTGKVEKLEPWLRQEYDLFVNIAEAEATLKQLLEDRADMQHQLDELKSNPQTADSAECKTIEDELELRSVQIQDIQQKLLDSEEDNKAKARLEKFQSMGEAKFALKFMFSKAAKVHKEKMHIQNKLNEVQESLNDTVEKLKFSEKQNQSLTEQIKELQKKEEFELYSLMRRTEESRKIEELQMKINDLQSENSTLRDNLESIPRYVNEHRDVIRTPVIKVESVKEPRTPENTTETKTNFQNGCLKTPDQINTTFFVKNEVVDDLNVSIEYDDVQKDPDWRKTPLGKRILEEKRKLTKTSLQADFSINPPKRSSDGGCTCRTNCTKRCGCAKIGKGCSSSCKCSSSVCENRNESEQSDSKENTPHTLSSEDESFKRPRTVDENLPQKRMRRTKTLFILDS